MAKQPRRIGGVKRKLPCVVFTFEQLILLKKVLSTFRQMILARKGQLPNAAFALETVTHLRTKITRMIAQRYCGEALPLDANEVLILQTSVSIFALGLEAMQHLPEEKGLKRQCQLLSVLLSTCLRPSFP